MSYTVLKVVVLGEKLKQILKASICCLCLWRYSEKCVHSANVHLKKLIEFTQVNYHWIDYDTSDGPRVGFAANEFS